MGTLVDDAPELLREWSRRNPEGPGLIRSRSHKKVWWECSVGHEWEAAIASRTNSRSGCPVCAGQKVVAGLNDLATLNPVLAAQWSPTNTSSPSEFRPRSGVKVSWICEKGHEWRAVIAQRTAGSGCPVCSGRVVETGVSDLATLAPHLVPMWHPEKNDRKPNEVCAGSDYRAWWVCDRGHEWSVKVCDISGKGTGCPVCWKKGFVSGAERDVSDWLSQYVELDTSNRSLIGKELDMVAHAPRIAVEYNGLYWHTEKFVGRDRHFDKARDCDEKGYQLIHVWEDDWKFRTEAVKRTILRKIGKSDEPRVNARDMTPVRVTAREARDFLEENHIQGYGAGRSRFGLEDANGTLQAVITIRHRADGSHEIVRFATSCIVRGGFSKLMKHAGRELGVTKWVTFADLGVSDGGLYESLGFHKASTLSPDYSYLVSGRREHKFNYRKARFKKDPNLLYEEGLTERELAELNGLERIYDAGKVRYEKSL